MEKSSHDSVTRHEKGHPENAGKNTIGTGRGENVVKKEGKEPGRYETEEKDESGRPAGKSTLRDQTSVDPKKTIS